MAPEVDDVISLRSMEFVQAEFRLPPLTAFLGFGIADIIRLLQVFPALIPQPVFPAVSHQRRIDANENAVRGIDGKNDRVGLDDRRNDAQPHAAWHEEGPVTALFLLARSERKAMTGFDKPPVAKYLFVGTELDGDSHPRRSRRYRGRQSAGGG